MVSRSNSNAEQNYAPLDLESMAIDYAMRRFCTYLIGSQHENVIIIDHLPFLRVFNGRRSGSIRTERIKLRQQDILFCLKFGKGRNNPADYLSRHASQWKSVSKSERERNQMILVNFFILCM